MDNLQPLAIIIHRSQLDDALARWPSGKAVASGEFGPQHELLTFFADASHITSEAKGGARTLMGEISMAQSWPAPGSGPIVD